MCGEGGVMAIWGMGGTEGDRGGSDGVDNDS